MTDRVSSRKAIEKVSELLTPILSPLGLVLVIARFINQGSRKVLEVTVHKPGSKVSLDDCEKVSRNLEKKLDKLAAGKSGPLVDGPFVLQVQSPGIDRKLKTQKELKVFVGELVEVQSKIAIDTLGHNFTGVLQDAEEGMVTIGEPTPVSDDKKSKKSKKKKNESLVLDPVTEITLEFHLLSSVRLSPRPVEELEEEESEEEEVLS
ncbi:MAG: hypothetical protein KC652_12040 [Cyanobacteria bacterium HKST-UBA01]|nr:hypothetical protein [Cyanobacteria bacterium HKST-UBA01]